MALNFPTGSATGQIYSAGGNSWIWTGYAWNSYSPTGIYLDDLQDVNTSGVASGQALIYNGSYWTNGSAGSAAGVFLNPTNNPSSGLYYINFATNPSGSQLIRTDVDLLWNPNTNNLILASGQGSLEAIIDGGVF